MCHCKTAIIVLLLSIYCFSKSNFPRSFGYFKLGMNLKSAQRVLKSRYQINLNDADTMADAGHLVENEGLYFIYHFEVERNESGHDYRGRAVYEWSLSEAGEYLPYNFILAKNDSMYLRLRFYNSKLICIMIKKTSYSFDKLYKKFKKRYGKETDIGEDGTVYWEQGESCWLSLEEGGHVTLIDNRIENWELKKLRKTGKKRHSLYPALINGKWRVMDKEKE